MIMLTCFIFAGWTAKMRATNSLLLGTVLITASLALMGATVFVGVCVAEPRCDGVTFWGFTDAYSWIDRQFGADDPLLFDEQYAVKPAYYGVLDALWRR